MPRVFVCFQFYVDACSCVCCHGVSHEQAEAPSNEGFTPLITLKRPGTISATRIPSYQATGSAAAASGASNVSLSQSSQTSTRAALGGSSSDAGQNDNGSDNEQREQGQHEQHEQPQVECALCV